MATHVLQDFHPIVRDWFEKTFHEPSPPQVWGWPSISGGNNTLILAPTGSGKTLAAFLWAINHLVEQYLHEELRPGVRILYVSPLKALGNDIEQNLLIPLRGIKEEAHRAGLRLPGIRTAVRSGDTPQHRRTAMVKHPPDILITTPESLYLMLTSRQSRKIFATVQYAIVDEIHSLCGNKRGVHLALTLERLAAVTEQEPVRIGLSATQRPLEEIAAFLGGQRWEGNRLMPRPVRIVDAGHKKQMDLKVECAAPDFSLMPQESIWPLVFTELLEHIRLHTTTLVFVNSRRMAEKVAATLNAMLLGQNDTLHQYAVLHTTEWSANTPAGSKNAASPIPHLVPDDIGLVKAYHGSMSRSAREQMEGDLRAGRLRCLVATSSLELGIDIGSIDLVIQLQSPKGIARGLQRVGRSGHLVTATSKGRIFPTHREDLVESAVVARAMMHHEVETTSIPKNCLDVLAQQIVAMVSVEEWNVEELLDLIRQAYCYRDLSEKLYRSVLQMLAGRYTHEAFQPLRARISWDKINNTLRALPGSGQLAITSGGTIADRGYFGVYLEDGKTRVGEVDEEFVYETRQGDTFLLGSSVWRVMHMEASRLLVAPAPGQPARMPFWRGEEIGRSVELAAKVGHFRREMNERLDSADCLSWLQHEFPIDPRAAWNIQDYFRRQREVAGAIPHDQLILVEGFHDEIGDPRIVVHSVFGRRVNGLLGPILAHRLHAMTGVEPQTLYNDDGIVLRCPDAGELPLHLFDHLDPEEAEGVTLRELPLSPLFGGQFRQNAARALLMPKALPGKRMPLWLQRLRAKDLLHIARQFTDFPLVIETMREVLNDILDFERAKEVLRQINSGTIRIKTVRTEVPSPFTASLLFTFIAAYMYEVDQPRADKMSQYLSINRELLSELVDLDSMKNLLHPDAIEHVERQLQHTAEGYKARSPEELFEILLRLGDASEDEILDRCVDGNPSFLETLRADGRAVPVPLSGGLRWVAGEALPVYVSLNQTDHTSHVIRRYLQNHGPVTATEVARRYGLKREDVEATFGTLSREPGVVHGHFLPRSDELQWCYRLNLDKVHRQTIAILRREIKPSSLAEFTHFLFSWQHLYRQSQEAGLDGVQAILTQLQGLALPAEIWEREILFRRIRDYDSSILSHLTSSGAVVWTGTKSGWIAPVLRGEGGSLLEVPAKEIEDEFHEPAKRILSYIRKHGASFFNDLRSGTTLSLDALNKGIAELFWNGMITNDLFAEVQNVKRLSRLDTLSLIERIDIIDPRHNPARPGLMQTARRAIRQVPGWSGRWSLVHLPGVMGDALPPEEQARRQALQLLERYGVLAREFARREDVLPWDLIAVELQRMEMRGEIRRGYFIEGLSGMQFALPAAVEEMRRVRSTGDRQAEVVLVNACDPANPYGPGVGSHCLDPVPNRSGGNYIAYRRGIPALVIENYGARLSTTREADPETIQEALRAFVGMINLPPHLRPFREVVVEHCDGTRPTESHLEQTLRSLGFHRDMNQTMRYDGYM